MKKGKKIAILGAGNVGATIAYTLTVAGAASEIALIDINRDKASGEAMDILQGTPFTDPVDIYAGDYDAAKDADIVIVTPGKARKPGQTRIDLAQANVNIIKGAVPEIVKYAPDAIYVVVSNPVDIITYTILRVTGLNERQVIGSGTQLDSARLRTMLAEHLGLNALNVHANVWGEHGDTSVIPWSLVTVAGMRIDQFCSHVDSADVCRLCTREELEGVAREMRAAGAKVIGLKGATYYAIALSVLRIVKTVFNGQQTVMTVSSMIHGQYGISDVCLSMPFIVDNTGIRRALTPPLTPAEEEELRASAAALKGVIGALEI